MVQITVQDRTYLLAADADVDETKQAVLDAMRSAPAFLTLRTLLGSRVEVLVTSTSSVVLEQHDDLPAPVFLHASSTDPDYDDIYGLDFL